MKKLSIVSNCIAIAASLIMAILLIAMDKSGEGITNSQFLPVRICMFAAGLPSLVKLCISSKEIEESRIWLWLYAAGLLVWLIFAFAAFSGSFFANIRTSAVTSAVLVAAGVYLEYTMTLGASKK